MAAIAAKSFADWRPDKTAEETRGLLAKRLQFINAQIGNFTKAIGEGRALDSLLPALEKVEAEKAAVEKALKDVDQSIAANKRTRPPVEVLIEFWRAWLSDWDRLPEEDRFEAIQALVRRVTIKTKELAEIELQAIPLSASSLVRPEGHLGARMIRIQTKRPRKVIGRCFTIL